MSIREDIERMECETLSPYATLSIHSRGRDDPEEQCDIRPVFSATETGFYTVRHSAG